MQKTVYQVPELRDSNDNIIQQGAFGKNTALSNSTNDGWIDYVMNNLEALHDVVGETSPTLDANGHVVEPANLAIGDEDGNRLKTSYLKLSGGKVTGIASFRTDLRMLDNQDNRWGGLYVPGTTSSVQFLSLYGGTRATGDARLNLYNTGNGKFELTGYSTDGANAYTLTHDNNGNLKWRGNTIAYTNVYLPLTGGILQGNIIIKNNADTNRVQIAAGNTSDGYSGGARISMYGKEYNSADAGSFRFMTYTDTDGRKEFIIKANGGCTWVGKEVERVNASGTDYIRYENGLQICWGGMSVPGATVTDATVTLPQAFKSSSAYMIAVGRFLAYSKDETYVIKSKSTTAFTWSTVGTVTNNSHSYEYIAVGFWK